MRTDLSSFGRFGAFFDQSTAMLIPPRSPNDHPRDGLGLRQWRVQVELAVHNCRAVGVPAGLPGLTRETLVM
jgi:hypothetical protein